MDQNEVTKHFLVGNVFRQATMHARIFCICCAMAWIRPIWLYQDAIWKKR